MFHKLRDKVKSGWSELQNQLRKENQKKEEGKKRDAIRLQNTALMVITVLELVRATLELYGNIPCA